MLFMAPKEEILTLPMLRIIAHDLENHLTGIYGSIKLLQAGMMGELTAKQKKYIDIIMMGARKTEMMILNLVDVKKMQEGIITPSPASFPASDLLGDLDWLVKEGALENKTVKLEAEPGLQVCADEPLTCLVLENLIENGLRHTAHGGQVRLKISRQKDGLLFEVTDDGEGIPEEQLKTIFDGSFNSPPPRRSPGLGLLFCRLVVELQGGKIQVESAPGRGAQFHFYLPQDGKIA